MNAKKAKAQRRLERSKALFTPQLTKVLHEEMLIESGQQQVPIKTMSLGGYKAALEKVTSGIGVVGTSIRIPDVVEDEWIMSEAQAQQLSDLQLANKYDAKILEQLYRTSHHYPSVAPQQLIGREITEERCHPLPASIDIPYDHSVMERVVREHHENDEPGDVGMIVLDAGHFKPNPVQIFDPRITSGKEQPVGKPLIIELKGNKEPVSFTNSKGETVTTSKFPFKLTDMHGDRGVICRVDPDVPVDGAGQLADIVIFGNGRKE